jgi:metal-responsive CopG/Arc/MetJ family transcriptional regulator
MVILSYTRGMKTAVSIPDDVFQDAERLAKRLKRSRSEIYSRAIAEYVGRHSPELVTEQMDRALAEVDGSSDPFAAVAAHRILGRAEW